MAKPTHVDYADRVILASLLNEARNTQEKANAAVNSLISGVRLHIEYSSVADMRGEEPVHNSNVYKAALEQISGLWPEPPNCATVNPDGRVGEREGKARAILLEAALAIARTALGKTCGV